MKIDSIFRQRKEHWQKLVHIRETADLRMVTCRSCGEEHTEEEMRFSYWICPSCGTYQSMSPEERIAQIADSGKLLREFPELQTEDPLGFPDYQEKLNAQSKKTGHKDAIVTGICEISGIRTAIGVMDAGFLMGSMGTVVGEKIVRLAEYAGRKKYPLLLFSASGGARMQEGLYSLMQMASTSAAVQQFKDRGGLFLSVFTNPTTGGVSASFASLGDISIAEPDALICFAGPRVIEQTIGQKLPEGFQHAEFLQEHGMLDLIVERKDQKKVLGQILRMHQRNG